MTVRSHCNGDAIVIETHWLAMALCVLLVGGEIGFLWCEVS